MMVMKGWEIKMANCEFCNIEMTTNQKIVLENDTCYFLQLNELQKAGQTLEGSGVIITKKHCETVFDLTEEEWTDTYKLLQEVKSYIDNKHHPDGYNIGWNVDEAGGQHINHAHLHVMPRYMDEKLAGKGIRSHLKDKNNMRG